MRRRRPSDPPLNPYCSAEQVLRAKELDVYHATVSPQFTLDDVAHWLFPEEIICKLKAAFPVSAAYSGDYSLDVQVPSGEKVELFLDFDDIAMQCPKQNIPLFTSESLAAPSILGVLQEIVDINKQFDKVRKVIEWFGEHKVTPGAARYYWPTILSLLPASHAVHETSGDRYREVTGIGEIIPLLRETAGIVASAHLCPHKETLAISRYRMKAEFTQVFAVL